MDVDQSIPTLINNSHHQFQQSETVEASFDEQLVATLGEDFPYPLSIESHTTSPQFDFDCDPIEQFMLPQITKNNNYNKDNDKIHSSNVQEDRQQCLNKEKTKNQATSSGTKRKRQPNQVQDHIIAERRRRELLSQMFISLSTIVPGLKKVDKTSVLGEAIKYMKQLQEKVKVLEDVAAKRTVESVVVVKKSQLIVDDDKGLDDNESSSTVDDNCEHGVIGSNGNGGNSNESNNQDNSLPEIEVKISGKTLLLRVYCEQQKGILAKLFAEVDKHDMNVTNCSVIPFGNIALDITIYAQMKNGFNKSVRDFVRTLHSALRLASHRDHVSREDNHT
ncbi:hypothetical protein BVRB_005810 [Beta vulgaris subsp. vulgaris]|uniref:BHLH domain-containing protein n=2 Tax=Beta vulgaris subsp. vulgaris TaxID=3555 RepID=A0A0J8B7C8_BETVV|nr:transcription factor bHLH18 isoform X2 [Beta vulgaris subsp. vulgaris]KMS95692.1 hypothetical protein BVRB_005810 [Beta vulgaris subsp. vulgaris]